MNIYLAARYDRHPEMRLMRRRLAALGHRVTSRWIDKVDVPELPPDTLNAMPEVGRPVGEMILDDINAADAVVMFTEWPSGSGGRHTEFGMGLALGKRMIIVGTRENVVHTLWAVEHYGDGDSFMRAMDGA